MANYTKRAGFYLNAEEKAVLDRRAAEAGMNRSEYIRHMIRTSNLKPYPEGFLKKVKEEIKVFGDEINEIAKAVNSRGCLHASGEGERVITPEPWEGTLASRRVEEGLSRSFPG